MVMKLRRYILKLSLVSIEDVLDAIPPLAYRHLEKERADVSNNSFQDERSIQMESNLLTESASFTPHRHHSYHSP